MTCIGALIVLPPGSKLGIGHPLPGRIPPIDLHRLRRLIDKPDAGLRASVAAGAWNVSQPYECRLAFAGRLDGLQLVVDQVALETSLTRREADLLQVAADDQAV